MEYKRFVLLIILAFVLVPVNCDESSLNGPYNRGIKECYHCRTNPPGLQASSGRPVCTNCRCCAGAVSDYFQSDQFEKMFSNRNSLEVEDHENRGFLDYESFITASAHYQPYGFGTTYINGNFFGTKEVAAFLAHVATKTSCEYFRVSILCCVVGLIS